MIIVVGGAYQGKLDFVLQQYGLTMADVADGEKIPCGEVPEKKVINHFHLLLRRMLFQDMKLQNVELQDTELQDTELQDTELQDTKLQDTELQDTKLQDMNQQDTAGHMSECITRQKSDAKDRLEQYIEQICVAYQDGIIICDEVGCGLVPMEACERAYRDVVGRCMCKLTAHAAEVIRVSCGIPQRIL